MAKFSGAIGYVSQIETAPGIVSEIATERNYRGDWILNQQRWQSADNQTNENFNIDNKLSIIADPYAYENAQFLKYVVFMGARWKIQSLDIKRPRLILQLGGVYNGPSPD